MCAHEKEIGLPPENPVEAVTTTTLWAESVVVAWAAFSPVRAVSILHLPDPMQHVRNACARNPYAPRVTSDRVALPAKRLQIHDLLAMHSVNRVLENRDGSSK
jgi:hypothetical protein